MSALLGSKSDVPHCNQTTNFIYHIPFYKTHFSTKHRPPTYHDHRWHKQSRWAPTNSKGSNQLAIHIQHFHMQISLKFVQILKFVKFLWSLYKFQRNLSNYSEICSLIFCRCVTIWVDPLNFVCVCVWGGSSALLMSSVLVTTCACWVGSCLFESNICWVCSCLGACNITMMQLS